MCRHLFSVRYLNLSSIVPVLQDLPETAVFYKV